MRIGQGYDVHRLATDRDLIIGGVNIPLVDHIIVSDNAYYSIFASKLVHNIMEEEIGEAAQYVRLALEQENAGISFE